MPFRQIALIMPRYMTELLSLRNRRFSVVFLALLVLSSCDAVENTSYTLYRSSLVHGVDRIHIATFDAKDGEKYNEENCRLAAELFKAQPDVRTRFWCERGRYSR
jgi:hypothetical protein